MNDSTSDTPTAQVAAAQNKILVTDARGRVIAVKKLSVLNYYQLTKAMAADVSDRTLNMAIIAAAVTRIDTTDLAFPRSEKDIEFVLQFLESEGFEAAARGVAQLAPKDDGTEVAKNSQGGQTSV